VLSVDRFLTILSPLQPEMISARKLYHPTLIMLPHLPDKTSCRRAAATICLHPLQVNNIFVFIRQVAVLFRHNNIFIFIRQVTPVPAF